jgi:hypothetical protein
LTQTSETPDPQRLQRHLRALSAVNRQLQAQLDSGRPESRWTTARVRRGSVGSEWLRQLQRTGNPGRAVLVHAPARGVFLIEGMVRREVPSGMISNALSNLLGPVRAVTPEELDRYREGPPVAVLEAGLGRPFVVVAGKRLAIRGLPLPHPVQDEEMLAFPVGEELQVAVGGRAGANRLERTRALLADEGAVRATVTLSRKITGRIRRVGARSR